MFEFSTSCSAFEFWVNQWSGSVYLRNISDLVSRTNSQALGNQMNQMRAARDDDFQIMAVNGLQVLSLGS